MTVVESYAVAVAMCVVTMLCWGSWANTQKLASKEWRFELFYWDYAVGIFLASLLYAASPIWQLSMIISPFVPNAAKRPTGPTAAKSRCASIRKSTASPPSAPRPRASALTSGSPDGSRREDRETREQSRGSHTCQTRASAWAAGG